MSGNGPGRGGINRGRGDADLTRQDPSSLDDTKFKEVTLPPSALQDLKDSQMVGVTKSAPTEKGDGVAAKSGSLGNAASGGGSANTQVILPKHRGAVERYFKRGD